MNLFYILQTRGTLIYVKKVRDAEKFLKLYHRDVICIEKSERDLWFITSLTSVHKNEPIPEIYKLKIQELRQIFKGFCINFVRNYPKLIFNRELLHWNKKLHHN